MIINDITSKSLKKKTTDCEFIFGGGAIFMGWWMVLGIMTWFFFFWEQHATFTILNFACLKFKNLP